MLLNELKKRQGERWTELLRREKVKKMWKQRFFDYMREIMAKD